MMLSKLKVYTDDNDELIGHTFYCPGCKTTHFLKKDTWTVRDIYRPSVNPSYNLVGRCHCIITNGIIDYLGDCKHEFAGYEVGMIPVCIWPKPANQLEVVDGVLKKKEITYLQSLSESLKQKAIDLILLKKKKKSYYFHSKKKWKKFWRRNKNKMYQFEEKDTWEFFDHFYD